MPTILRHLKALADETRLRLALVLLRHELSVNELVTLLEMGQSRVSRHLKILAEAGLLQARRDGLWVFYSAVDNGPARDFLSGVLAFSGKDGKADLDMADRIIEERARKTRQFFNSIAEDWDELNREVLGDFSLPCAVRDLAVSARRAEGIVAKTGVAVDLGCGTGEVLEHIRDQFAEIIGVDGSPRMLELARRRFSDDCTDISLRIGELDHLPLRDAEADFACINLVLHHLSRPQDSLNEIARVLKPGGLVLVTDFDRHQVETMRAVYGDRWLGFSQNDLGEMLNEVDMEMIECVRHEVKKGLALHLVLGRKRLEE